MEVSAPLELRLSGRTLSGAAMVYGSRASDRDERFEARSLEPVPAMPLVIQHDTLREIAAVGQGLDIIHTDRELRVAAELRQDSAELSLVRRGVLTGLSVGFVALEEHRDSDGMRVIRRARLHHVGLVDDPSYPAATVELRRRMADAWLSGLIRYDTPMGCRCQGPECDTVVFDQGALVIPDEVLAINGPATRVLGSRKRGTLLLDDGDEGLRVGLVGPDDGLVAREVKDAARVAPVHVRPILDDGDSEFVVEGTTRRFTRASVRALLVKTAVADRGHVPVKIRGIEEAPAPRSRRLWL